MQVWATPGSFSLTCHLVFFWVPLSEDIKWRGVETHFAMRNSSGSFCQPCSNALIFECGVDVLLAHHQKHRPCCTRVILHEHSHQRVCICSRLFQIAELGYFLLHIQNTDCEILCTTYFVCCACRPQNTNDENLEFLFVFFKMGKQKSWPF